MFNDVKMILSTFYLFSDLLGLYYLSIGGHDALHKVNGSFDHTIDISECQDDILVYLLFWHNSIYVIN